MVIKHANSVEMQPVEAGEKTSIQVLLPGPNFTMRKFAIAFGGGMPEHTNTVEHEQYVLQGNACITVGKQTFQVQPGDVVFIPEGEPHSYQNTGKKDFQFLCIIPNNPDVIQLVNKDC